MVFVSTSPRSPFLQSVAMTTPAGSYSSRETAPLWSDTINPMGVDTIAHGLPGYFTLNHVPSTGILRVSVDVGLTGAVAWPAGRAPGFLRKNSTAANAASVETTSAPAKVPSKKLFLSSPDFWMAGGSFIAVRVRLSAASQGSS